MADSSPSSDLSGARARMVADQLERRGIRDARVLDAMREIPRHLFVPPALVAAAYDDRALAIGRGQTISQPYMVAAMSQALRVSASAHVLEIGTGSGYQAAILARLARDVFTIERDAELARDATKRLAELGAANVTVIIGDGTAGYAAAAPYDRIIVTAGAPYVPPSLKAQLADGGRLVVPVGSRLDQRLLIVERHGRDFVESQGDACVFVPLIGEQGWPEGSGDNIS